MKKVTAPFGASLIVLSSLFYASYGVWTKLMGDSFGGYTASGLRSVLVVLILIIPAYYYKQIEPLAWRKNGKYILSIMFASMFVWGPFYWSILQAGIATAVTLNYAGLVLGMFFFGWLWHNEQFTRDKLISSVLGLFGLMLVFSPAMDGLQLLPLLAAAFSGICIGATIVLTKNLAYNSTQSTLVLWVAAVAVNLPLGLILGEPFPAGDLGIKWLYLLLFAIASVSASWLLVTGLKYVEAGVAGILGLLEIVFAAILGVVLFDEHVRPITILGMAVIIIAAAIPYIKGFKRAPPVDV